MFTTMTPSKSTDEIQDGEERELYRILGERLSILRRNKNLSQTELGAALGFSRDSVSRWESGHRTFTVATAIQIAKLLGVSVAFLLDPDQPIEQLSNAESELLQNYRTLAPEHRETAENVLRSFKKLSANGNKYD
jgi:transcriptional regulator with XRE-family HTH domain